MVKALIFSIEFRHTYKLKDNDFTRVRKQSFSGTLLFMMNRITKSLSIEIVNFICLLRRNKDSSDVDFFTKSAFTQYRQKIKPEVFKALSASLVDEFYTDNDDNIKLWRGFRLLAVDGSRLTLPNTKTLELDFGVSTNQSDAKVVQGRMSVLYDILNGIVIDGIIAPLAKSENYLALEHLKHASEGDLILYDRGYPSFEMIYEHKKLGIDFLFRVQTNFNNQVRAFLSSPDQEQIANIYPGKNISFSDKEFSKDSSISVRYNKVILEDGTIEVLISSLLDVEKYNASLFKKLYYERWKIETFYDELKNKLKMGHFSGYSPQSIYQDFYSTLFVSNIQSLLIREINDELKQKKDQTRYLYKVNANISYGILKDRIIEMFLTDKEMGKITTEIKELLKRHLIPERPNRNFARNTDKYRKRTKPHIVKNQKYAF